MPFVWLISNALKLFYFIQCNA